MERIVELVQHRRGEHPHGLVALDLLQPRAQRLGAIRRLLGRGELRAEAKVVSAHAEERADQHGEGVVDDARARSASGPVSVPLPIRVSETTSKTT